MVLSLRRGRGQWCPSALLLMSFCLLPFLRHRSSQLHETAWEHQGEGSRKCGWHKQNGTEERRTQGKGKRKHWSTVCTFLLPLHGKKIAQKRPGTNFMLIFFLLLREESPPDVRGRVRQTWNVHRNVGESEQSQCCSVTDVVPRILSRE